MAAWLNVCRFIPTAGGTADWTYSSAVVGYQGPALSGAVNGRVYKFRAESADLSQWELAEGAYNSGTGVFARTTVLYNSSGTGTATGQSGAGTKINFSTVPQVAIVALKEDLLSIEEANSFSSTQKDQARVNILAAGVVRVQSFAASGTYTPHANLLYAVIEAIGAGGGGGSSAGSLLGFFTGGGGGSGGYSRKIASVATIGASQIVTIGAKGVGGASGSNNGTAGADTSVGSLCIAKGGSGGVYGSAAQGPLGGNGGVAGTGDFTAAGAPGTGGFYGTGAVSGGLSIAVTSGSGGSSAFGGGAAGVLSGGATTPGNAASNYGSGGSGGATNNTTSTVQGGDGTDGFVFITEFCSK